MALIARGEGRLVSGRDIAQTMQFSRAHLAKVLQRLVHTGLLCSVRGPKGGFVLARPANKITLLDIYEVIEGPLSTEPCPVNAQECPFGECILKQLPERLTSEFRDFLSATTLADISQKE
jgi:Rrf2 family protein